MLLGVLAYFGYRYFTGGSGTITVWTIKGNEDAVKQVATVFSNSHRGFKINIVPVAESDYETKALFALATQKGSKDYPVADVWIMPNEWMEQHRNKLVPAPDQSLDTAIQNYKIKRAKGEAAPQFPAKGRTNLQVIEQDYAPIAKTDLVKNDQVWGVPLYMDTLALYYDKTKVATPPKTWSDVVSITKKLTNRTDSTINQSAFALGDNQSINHFTDIISILMLQSGAKMIDEASRVATFNVDGSGAAPGVKALDYYTSFAKPGRETYTWNRSLGQSIKALKDGKTAMALGYLNDVSTLGSLEKSRIAVAPLPQTDVNNPQTYGRYLVATVTKQAQSTQNEKKVTAAWDFVSLFANPDISQQYAEKQHVTPARNDVAQRIELAPVYKPFLDQVGQAIDWPKAEVQVANGALNDAVNLVLKDNATPQVALNTSAKNYTIFLQTETGIVTDPAVISLWQSTEDATDFKPVIDLFLQENSDIKRVSLSKHSASRYEWELLNAMAAHAGPDIALIENDRMRRYSATLQPFPKGTLNPAQQRADDLLALQKLYNPPVYSDNVFDGKIYGVPANFETLMLAVNYDAYTKRSREEQDKPESEFSKNENKFIDGPLLWDDLKELSRLATKRDGETISLPYVALGTGSNVAYSADLYAVLVKQLGGHLTDPDRNVSGINLPFSSQNTTIAGKQAEELLKSFTQPQNNFYTWNSSLPNSLEALADGKVISAFLYPRDVQTIKARNPQVQLRGFALPQVQNNTTPVDFASYFSMAVPLSSSKATPSFKFISSALQLSQGTSLDGKTLVSPRKPTEPVKTVDRQSAGNPQSVQGATSTSYYKGYYPEELDTILLNFMDNKLNINQAADQMSQSLKKRIL